jgi:3D (Asp-Asp-Asp) domain-containing protein
MTLQADLAELGYTQVGPMDGVFGPKTRAALQAFEAHAGLPVTGATNPIVWQDILAGFGLMPPDSATAAPAAAQDPPRSSTRAEARIPRMIDGRPVIGVFHMLATAYGPSMRDNYPYGPVDYFGQPLEPGMVAVDPSVIPLKTYLYVTGYTDRHLPSGGFLGRAMDTGGAIRGDRIDIFMDAGSQTVSNFGIEPVTVYELGQ